MKIFKERHHALLNRPVTLQNQNLLCLGIMLYFDLQQPDRLLNEQDLWQELPPLLGDTPLDAGWAKPRGEFLLAGHSHAPQGQTCRAQEVRVELGELNKSLNVFGERTWQRNSVGQWSITDPQPYSAIPLDWSRSYGGSACEDNPLGMGAPVKGESAAGHMLPCVENPSNLLVVPEQKIAPVGFSPLQPHWPQRRNLSGTYDQNWVDTAWPDLPANLNPEFFMAAPADQRLPGYFQGKEQIALHNLHPEQRLINSRLPSQRIRAFLTRRNRGDNGDRGADDKELQDAQFFEPHLQADTLWLFPDLLRGVLIYRAVITCADDEYSDLARLMVVTEETDSKPLSLEHYWQVQRERADLKIPSQAEIRKEISAKLSVGALTIRNLPKTIKRRKFAQEKPVMVNTPQQTQAIFEQQLQSSEATINQLQEKMTGMHQKFGHRVAIPFERFAAARDQVGRFRGKLGQMTTQAQEMLDKKDQALKQAKERLAKNTTPQQLAKADVDLDHLGGKPAAPFHRILFPLVCDAKRHLHHFAPKAHLHLLDAGITREQQNHFWLGRLEKPHTFSAVAAGLDEQQHGEPCEVPAGWLLPRFDGAYLVSLSIWQQEDENETGELTGNFTCLKQFDSKPQPAIFLPATIESGITLWVGDPFSALLLEPLVGDFAHIACFPSEDEKLEDEVQELLSLDTNTEKLGDTTPPLHLCFLTKELDNAGKLIRQKTVPAPVWIDLPNYQSLFYAHGDGEDLRELVLQALPGAVAHNHRLILASEKGDGAKGLCIEEVINPDMIKSHINDGLDQGRKAMEQRMAPALKQKEAMLARAEEQAAQHGIDLKPHFAKAKAEAKLESQKSITQRLNEAAQKIEKQKETLAKHGQLTDDVATKLDNAAAKMRADGSKWQAKKDQLYAMEPPPKIAAVFAKHGMDPQRLKPLTPATLAHRLEERDLKQATLKGLDLRGVDFSGIELDCTRFSKCQLQGAKFNECNIHFSQFSNCQMEETDFTGAQLDQVMLTKCKMQQSIWLHATTHLTTWSKCDATAANFSASKHENCMWQQTILRDTLFNQARLSLCMLLKADAQELQAREALFEKCMCKGLTLNNACFDGMETKALLFHGCSGEGVSCSKGQLFKLRFNHNCVFPALNLQESIWQQGYVRNSILDELDLRGGRVEDSMFDSAKLRRAQLTGVALTGCRFLKCDLEQAQMRGCNLFHGSLHKSRLVETDLRDSNLYGVDFRKAVVGATRLERANLKRSLLEGKGELVP